MKKKIQYPIEKLEPHTIEQLIKIAPLHTYSAQSDLFYEGQTPVVAFLLIKGQVQLVKKKKVRKILNPGDLIGLRELIEHSPFPLSAQILPNTEVCFLDKSTIFDILNASDDHLSEIIKEILYTEKSA